MTEAEKIKTMIGELFTIKLLATTKHANQRISLRFANGISKLMPPTRCFVIRRALYRYAGMKVGENVRIVGGASFHYSNVEIGDDTWVGSETHFFTSSTASIFVGKRVDIAPHCLFNTGTHKIGDQWRRAGTNIAHSISIGDGTWIGMGVKVLDGTSIGKGCIIAAGAVVRGCFPDNVLIGGIPARIIKPLYIV